MSSDLLPCAWTNRFSVFATIPSCMQFICPTRRRCRFSPEFIFYDFVIAPIAFFLFCCLSFFFPILPSSSSSIDTHTNVQLSNGFDHYSPASSPYLHSNGGSSGSATAFPFYPTPSSPSTSTSSPTRSWPRPASALLPDYPPYCTLGPMIPSSKVPSWKVCLLIHPT